MFGLSFDIFRNGAQFDHFAPNQALFSGLLIQFQPHENKLLPPGRPGAEALRVSAVLDKAHALVQGKGGFILRIDTSIPSLYADAYGFCFNTRSIGAQPMYLGRSPESAVMASISR